MPDYFQREDDDGTITVGRDGQPSMTFEGRPQLAQWESAYITCMMVNGTPQVCFTRNPPQVPVGGGAGRRPSFAK